MARTEYHLYDINLIQIRQKLNKTIEEIKADSTKQNLESLIQDFDTLAEIYCESAQIDYKNYLKTSLPILIDSKPNSYSIFIAFSLIVLDIYKITSFLNYHFDSFKGNYYAKDKSEFIGLVEFTIYERVKRTTLDQGTKRVELIMAWVDEKRKNFNVSPVLFTSKILFVNDNYFAHVYNALEVYFDKSEHQKLKLILKGEPIEGTITFIGPANQILDAFLQLHKNQIILSSKINLEKWISLYFKYKDEKEVKPILPDYAHKIISTNKQPCISPIQAIHNILK